MYIFRAVKSKPNALRNLKLNRVLKIYETFHSVLNLFVLFTEDDAQTPYTSPTGPTKLNLTCVPPS